MRANILRFVEKLLSPAEILNARVIEIGSFDVNGTPRPAVIPHKPKEYIGIDIVPGPGVDRVLPVSEALEAFGPQSFDIVLCLEMLEHVEDWRRAIHVMKQLLKPKAILIVTTRSPGYPYHPHPIDTWRYTPDDFRKIFRDMKIDYLKPDDAKPGVFLRARRPKNFVECDLSGIDLVRVEPCEP